MTTPVPAPVVAPVVEAAPAVAPVVEAAPVEAPVVEAAPTTELAVQDRFDIATVEAWDHEVIEFKGDRIGIRLPTQQSLVAFSLISSKYVSSEVRKDLTSLFIVRHLSPESYGRVFSRMMDPDEADYDVDTVGELFNDIVAATVTDADNSE